jgi:dolichyl-phosphate beta-glucosyltransferase
VTFTYILPVHNQEAVLEATVRELQRRLESFPGSEVILVENGSTDSSAALCARLAATPADRTVAVRSLHSATGLGNALRCGMAVARGDVVVLTAADLPFGFSDLDAWLAHDPHPPLAIGSKAHPDSATQVPWLRSTMSAGFRVARRAVLGMRTGDSQGTIFISTALCRQVLPHLRCSGFLISTEVIAWATNFGADAVELPVVYVASGGSTVSPLADSLRMLRGLIALRRRLAAPARRTAIAES